MKPLTMTSRKPLTAAILSIALFSACQVPEKPVSQQEALDLARKIETSISQHTQTVLDDIIDQKYFASLVLRQAHQRFNFNLAMKARAALTNFRMGQLVVAATQKAGSYELVRRYEKDGHQHLLFRLFGDDGDINYHDFELIKGDQGVKADDVFIFASGEQISKAVTESLLGEARTVEMTDEEKEDARLVREAIQYLAGGNPEEAYSFYDQLPDKIKKEQKYQKLHLRIAEKLGDSAYRAAQNEYKTNFPQDPFIYFTIFRTNARQNDYASSLDALNRFDSFLPDDPFLDFYRGLLYKLMNNPLQSRLTLERFHTRWPLVGTAVGELIDSHMKADHPDSAALLVMEAEKLNNITPAQLDAIEKAYPAIRPYLK
jgi:hypothetical protein